MGDRHAASAARQEVLHRVAERIEELGLRPVRVGIDGVDGAGKSWFGDELAAVLRERGHAVLRASIDDFHHPREVRYRRGRHDPGGYWQDSFDLDAFRAMLLDPLGPGGDRRVVRAIHDVDAEAAVPRVVEDASEVDVAIVDGIFLHRDEVVDHWDLSVWLEVPFDVSIARMAGRDGGDPDASAAANRRYVEGQRRYLDTCDPASRATVRIDNRNVDHPTVSAGPSTDEEGAVRTDWLPDDFEHPERVEVDDDHHLRPIRADDVDLDMVAVMGSRERLWSTYGDAWGWPPATMTREQDREDLARHAAEMVTHESFNYALFDTDETALLGCVYLDPPEKVGADAEISWWVVDDLVGSKIERRLDTLVPTWIALDWPLRRPRYVGRDLSWDAWLALPDLDEAGPST